MHNLITYNLKKYEKRYVRLTFLHNLPIRWIITTDKGRYFSLIRNTCNKKKLKKFDFLPLNNRFKAVLRGICNIHLSKSPISQNTYLYPYTLLYYINLKILHFSVFSGTESRRGCWPYRSRRATSVRNQGRNQHVDMNRNDVYRDTTTYPSSGY